MRALHSLLIGFGHNLSFRGDKLDDETIQRPGRRTSDISAIIRELRAMAGANELALLIPPRVQTAQMRADFV